MVPKINKQIWQQLRQDTRNSDSAFQKAQSQLISGLSDPVGSFEVVSQSSIASIIANQTPFRAGGLQESLYMWEKITSDPFILDTVTHCHIEFDFDP